tara:strand:+ start:193 stop:351 length:159 start_codon:yes stop_codon:yes gene_type:complete
MTTEITEIENNLKIWKRYSPGSWQYESANKILTKYHKKYGTVDTSIIKQLIK